MKDVEELASNGPTYSYNICTDPITFQTGRVTVRKSDRYSTLEINEHEHIGNVYDLHAWHNTKQLVNVNV
jgi:hypothetical protein